MAGSTIPTQAEVEAALKAGQPLPAGEYAVDYQGGVKVRALTAAERAYHAALQAEQKAAAATPEPDAE